MDEVIADFIAGILAGDVAEIIADSASGRSSVPPAPHIIDGFIIVFAGHVACEVDGRGEWHGGAIPFA